MMFQALPTTQLGSGLEIGALIIGLAVAVIFHEVSHGYAALKLGDPTAYYAGRLTLNPLKHIDLWGTILFPILLLVVSGGAFTFGWAKPVPVNYYNLRRGKWGPVIVALVGPLTNFVLLVIAALLVRISPLGTALPSLFFSVALINGVLMLFNLIPVPPLDGSKILYLFLENRPDVIQQLEAYGMFILMAFLLFGMGILQYVVFGPALWLVRLIAGV